MIIVFLLKFSHSSFFLRIHLAIATFPLFAILRMIRLFVLSLQADTGKCKLKRASKDTHLASRYTDVYAFGVKFVLQRRIVSHLPRIMYIHTFHNRWIHTHAIQHTLQKTCTKIPSPNKHLMAQTSPLQSGARGSRGPTQPRNQPRSHPPPGSAHKLHTCARGQENLPTALLLPFSNSMTFMCEISRWTALAWSGAFRLLRTTWAQMLAYRRYEMPA